MPNNNQKFLFLVVVVLFTGVASRQFIVAKNKGLSDIVGTAIGSKEIPLVKLSPPLAEIASSFSSPSATEITSDNLKQGGDLSTAHDSQKNETTTSLLQNLPLIGESFPTYNLDPNFGGAVRSEESSISSSFIHRGQETPPTLQVEEAYVGDLGTGEKFLGKNNNKRWPAASLTKLITAVIALRVLDANQSTTLMSADFVSNNSNIIMSAGERYKVTDLLHVMLLASSNEAAEALARTYGRPQFMAKMNGLAREWGLSNTYFDDPTGLSATNESTADDLKTLATHIYHEYPQIFEITRQDSYVVTELNSGSKKTVKSINNFAGQANFLGGKTGYTDEASGNLLSIFSYEHRPLIIIVLGTDDRFGQTENLLSWFEKNYK